MNYNIVALHGSFASGAMLRRDTGICEWYYPDWHRSKVWKLTDWLYTLPNLVLVGTSLGGSLLAELTHCVNIRAAILYESPILGKPPYIEDPYPILWIENHKGRRFLNRRSYNIMEHSKLTWQQRASSFQELEGRGRHIKTNPLGFNWDQDLNPAIQQFISTIN